MENISFDAILQHLNQNYYDLYPDMHALPVNVIVTDCLSKSNLELRPDLKEQLMEIEMDDNSNGRMVLPKAVGDTINILLNISKMIEYTEDGSMTWIGTYAHELTHAIDYHGMALKEKLDIYDPLLQISDYLMFQLWSEYHARKLGYSFLSNQLNMDTIDKNDRIDHILDQEWPYHLQNHFTQYHETGDGNKQMYYTMQLLGRYSVWCDWFPEYFNESVLKEIFIQTPWMFDIFHFLRQNNSLDNVYLKFENMRLILKENWIWL